MRSAVLCLGLCVVTTYGCASVAVSTDQRREGEVRPVASTYVRESQGGASSVVTALNRPPSFGAATAIRFGTEEKHRIAVTADESIVGEYTATANLEPSDDGVVGPPSVIEDCERRLNAAKVDYRPAKVPIVVQNKMGCGAYQAVQYLKGPGGLVFEPRPVVSCPLALGLARFESIVQRLALKYFEQHVKSVRQGGTYRCRAMARFKLVSEHSYANAIDLYGFTLANGKPISVARDFGAPNVEPKGKEGAFLRELFRTAYDEGVFSVVVTRYFDELHRDHVHVDMAHYRTDGTR